MKTSPILDKIFGFLDDVGCMILKPVLWCGYWVVRSIFIVIFFIPNCYRELKKFYNFLK